MLISCKLIVTFVKIKGGILHAVQVSEMAYCYGNKFEFIYD